MKPQTRARLANAARSVLRLNRICIVNLNEPYHLQTTFSHGNRKLIMATERISRALLDVPHRWTLYLAVFCQRQDGEQYTKAIELETGGIYRAAQLTDVIREHHVKLVQAQNPGHVVSSGWIAFPYPIEYAEADADALFSAAIEVSKEYQNVKPPEPYTV